MSVCLFHSHRARSAGRTVAAQHVARWRRRRDGHAATANRIHVTRYCSFTHLHQVMTFCLQKYRPFDTNKQFMLSSN